MFLRLSMFVNISQEYRRLSISMITDIVQGMTPARTRDLDPDIRLLAALADPARLAIVRELADEPRPARAISPTAVASPSRPCRTTSASFAKPAS